MQITADRFSAALARHGWLLRCTHGSHEIYGKPSSDVRLSVPVHGNQSLKTGLAVHLMKAAGLSESDI